MYIPLALSAMHGHFEQPCRCVGQSGRISTVVVVTVILATSNGKNDHIHGMMNKYAIFNKFPFNSREGR